MNPRDPARITWNKYISFRTSEGDNLNVNIKLDSIAIWVFAEAADQQDGSSLTIQETYEFDFSDNKLIESVMDNAEAFDISQECYIQNEQMIHGRDYAWVNFGYQMDRVYEFWRVTDLLESRFYQYIMKATGLDHFRVPRLRIIWRESAFTLRFLILDALDPHLVYDQVNSYALDMEDDGLPVSCVEECSKLCKKIKCTAMTFHKTSYLAGTCKMATHQIGMLKPREGAVTYVSRPEELMLPSLTELGVDRQVDLMRPGGEEVKQMLGYGDYFKSQTGRAFAIFSYLNTHLAQIVNGYEFRDLTPSSLTVDSNEQ